MPRLAARGGQRSRQSAVVAARRAQLHGYCSGCHSLKYMRYSRVAEDLKISDELRDALLVKPGDKFSDYIKASMPAADAQEWFGKPPPDLSLVARSRGSDWVFNFLTTFYADPASRQTGVNNLQLPGTAMPHVLASVQGVQTAVWSDVEHKGEDGKAGRDAREFKKFEPGVVGSLTPAQYDEFARDTVNFLEYVGDPSQLERQGLGIWVVLVPAHVHGYRVHAEEGILEGRPLNGPDLIGKFRQRRVRGGH